MDVVALPDPPHGHSAWSIVTLAEHLRVAPAAVDALLVDPIDEYSPPDLLAGRFGHHYMDAAGESCGDCWISPAAAERIADALPAARIARAVLAVDPARAAALISAPALRLLAEHVLTHAGT